ncbi:MAG: glycerophosphodiester phosphodiesterase family protein [Deltaproteobacteria bacterium]|nr:glycerophosphodiester phosphodiesterase family protein [Deltaproteobacteria bacterium]
MSEFILFAHRGASGYEPENTRSAFELALAMGARWIELDVYAVDGELVVIHDDCLERTTNGTGFVMDKGLSYLRTLDAGKGQKIPLLREVFDLVSDRAGINIELKGPKTATLASALIAAAITERRMTAEQFIVSSFNHKELLRFKTMHPEIRLGALASGVPWRNVRFAEKMGAYAVHAGMNIVNRRFVANAHRRGLKFFVYTVNTGEDLKRMQDMGVDGVFTNYPDLMSY